MRSRWRSTTTDCIFNDTIENYHNHIISFTFPSGITGRTYTTQDSTWSPLLSTLSVLAGELYALQLTRQKMTQNFFHQKIILCSSSKTTILALRPLETTLLQNSSLKRLTITSYYASGPPSPRRHKNSSGWTSLDLSSFTPTHLNSTLTTNHKHYNQPIMAQPKVVSSVN